MEFITASETGLGDLVLYMAHRMLERIELNRIFLKKHVIS